MLLCVKGGIGVDGRYFEVPEGQIRCALAAKLSEPELRRPHNPVRNFDPSQITPSTPSTTDHRHTTATMAPRSYSKASIPIYLLGCDLSAAMRLVQTKHFTLIAFPGSGLLRSISATCTLFLCSIYLDTNIAQTYSVPRRPFESARL